MLNTTLDIFWLVFAIVLAFVGVASGIAIIYATLSLRDFHKIVASTKKKLDLADRIMEAVVDKVEATASFVPPLIEGTVKLVTAMIEKKNESAKSAKKKK